VLLLGPHPLAAELPAAAEGLALLLSATDADGLATLLALATPTVPPMTRAPFANTVPDLLVTGPRPPARGWGGLRAAGHLDAQWRADVGAGLVWHTAGDL
jgi:hypothetical protein